MAGSLIIPSVTDDDGQPLGSGRSRLEYWRDLADQLGRRQTLTVSSQATTAEGGRLVVIDDLLDDDVDDDDLRGAWLYVLDGPHQGEQRRILESGYHGAVGATMLSRPFSSPLTPGTGVEITAPLPVLRSRAVKGLVTLCEEALMRLRADARIAFTGDGTHRVSLADYPWITSMDWTDGVYDRRGGDRSSEPPRRSRHEYDLTVDGATVTLELERAYGEGEPFHLKTFVPADRLLFDGAGWAYTSASGAFSSPLADGYQAVPSVRQVTTLGMVKALEFLLRSAFEDDHLTADRRTRLLTRYDRDWPQWSRAAEQVMKAQPRRTRELPRHVVSVIGRSARHRQGLSGWR